MSSYIKGSAMDFYSPSDLGIDNEQVEYADSEGHSELEWNYFYKFVIAYNGACSMNYIDGVVIANDEYEARAKLMNRYKSYENAEIRNISKTDIIELGRS